MSEPEFQAPSVEVLNSLLPAFEFSQVLAANEHGAVYYARQKSLDREVAIKLFSPALGATPRFMKAFASSVAAVARVNHANLIGVFDSGAIDKMPYVVMEFVPGKSLARSTYGHAIALDQSMSIIGEVCAGIAFAHDQDLVHGNLSPMNILLNRKPSPKIGNFGLDPAIHTVPEAGNQTHFSAPEVLAGEPPTRASDIYSIAAMFYELITGLPHGPIAPPASTIVAVPDAVDRAIERATSRDPAERGADALAFFKSLEKATTATTATAGKTGRAARRASRPVSSSAAAAAMMASLSERLRQKLWIKATLIVVLVVAIQQVWTRLRARQAGLTAPTPVAAEVAPVKLPLLPQAQPPVAGAEPQTLSTGDDHVLAREATPAPPTFLPGPAPAESPLESLQRLRSALKEGNRSEMPIGAIRKGDAYGLLVSQPMTWPDAALFAESHGGYLALPQAAAAWRTAAQAGGGLWVGAAGSGTNTCTLVDGRAWSPGQPIAHDKPYVWLDQDGQFKTADAGKALAFIIEWRADGSNPATLAAQLHATAASLRSSQAVYPPGTRPVGDRHYLPVMRQVTWDEANQMARSGGGHLMGLSDNSEIAQIAQLDPGPDLWLGATLVGDLWVWSSGEPWSRVHWINESNALADNSSMVLRCGKGLDAMLKSETASGFIIEWSNDPQAGKASAAAPLLSLDALRELSNKAKALVVAADATKEEAHRKNLHKLGWDLDAYVRPLKKSDYEIWAPEVGKLKTCLQNPRLSMEAISGAGVKLSPYMEGRVKYHLAKQVEIDNQYTASIKTVHGSFVAKMGEISDQAKAAGQARIHRSAAELMDAASDADAWASAISGK